MVAGSANLKGSAGEPTPLHSCDGASDAFEDARKRTGLDRMVRGNDLVMLTVAWGCHSHVRSLLPSHIVAENS